MTRVRFAPSPAGLLFLSGARVALANHLFARRRNGRMLLRLDDLDEERRSQGQADAIMQDLRWLGVSWDDCIRQSDRLPLYQDAIERLKRDGLLYPCFETGEELKAKLEFRRKRGQPLVYDRAMLRLTDKQRRDAEAGGKRPHWRFRLPDRMLEWHDLVLGRRHATLAAVSDPVVAQADGLPAPILASVVDDIDSKTTHVIRGEDSAGNTAAQIALFEALMGIEPAIRFAHLPALTDSEGTPGGRHFGSLSLRSLRNDGVEPRAIAACLAGVTAVDAPPPSLEDLAAGFELSAMAQAKFDMARLLGANRAILRTLDFAAVADRLPGGATEAFWLAVRGELDLLKEARGWWDVVAGSIVPPIMEDDRDVLVAACETLPPEPWDTTVWSRWIAALERATGRTVEALLTPLRLALTGEETGPDLASLLPLIGRALAASRLGFAAA
ncbi:glutamate--tRNA ligase [Rhodopila globiformis]|uniref:Glutamate--tRNA ligase n=1 Tax=Rhodopila globiformis TaxID=1071 RepID=A0A2S6N2R0_RHOGL|nr:glutamate--tRNA ligase family protein [Rhodopila globiformis]PPQ28889.1 glutamate--tRNA ligase [Rhodopila globiformis]